MRRGGIKNKYIMLDTKREREREKGRKRNFVSNYERQKKQNLKKLV
jgi:hypothetical protein